MCARSGERIPIELSISDVVVHGRRLFTVIARDITERRRTEAEMREADHRKDVFLGMLAHELRNPLAAITTAVEVLHRIDAVEAHRMTNVIRRQTEALARMVDDLLDVSRVTLGKIQLARRAAAARRGGRARDRERSRSAARAQVQLSDLDRSPSPCGSSATRRGSSRCLTNLLNNAIKFTPAGGSVAIDARREGTDAVIRVRDTGHRDRALAAAESVRSLRAGRYLAGPRRRADSGIGLALVRQVVQMHGGDVSAQSEGPGQRERVYRASARLA